MPIQPITKINLCYCFFNHNVRFHFKFSGLKKLVKLNGYEIEKNTINFNENTIF